MILTGKLGKDVELRYTPQGKSVATFSLAVNDNFNRELTHWINIIVWGKSAENCANYIGKGSHVAVEGRINTRNYENQEGKKIYITEVVADRVEFLDKKGDKHAEKKGDSWDELGREVRLEDVDMGGNDDSIPF